jgi:serine/threonine protein kinase
MEHPTIRGLSGWIPLARGGNTLVWEARQDLLSRPVAVKVYRPGLAVGIYETFTREAGVAGRLSDHPGVVTVYDAGLLPDARPYLIMELCAGGSLTQWLDPANVRSEDQIRRVGMRVADALAGLHARGVLHRDVKPANILIDGFGRPRLADFGLAAVVGVEAAATDALRMTPAYAPPEAFTKTPATEAGDVFSLAATLYALLAGHPPRTSDAGDLQSMVDGATKPITPLPGVNWFLMDVLMAALSTDSAARPSAVEFRDRLSTMPGSRTRKGKTPLAAVGQLSPALPERRVLVAAAARGEAQPVRTPRTPARRRVGLLATAAALIMLAASGTAWLIAEPASSGAPTAAIQQAGSTPVPSESSPSQRAAAPSSPTPARSDRDAAGSVPVVGSIQIKGSTATAQPFETIRLRGTYRGGGQRFLQVQWRRDGAWQAFPVPAKTDTSGEFTAYVELGRPDSYRLRVRDPHSGVTSEPFTLVIEGAD